MSDYTSEAEARIVQLESALRECREAWASMVQCLKEDEIRVSAVGHMSGWVLMERALAADTPTGAEEIEELNAAHIQALDERNAAIRELAAIKGTDVLQESARIVAAATPQEGTGEPTPPKGDE